MPPPAQPFPRPPVVPMQPGDAVFLAALAHAFLEARQEAGAGQLEAQQEPAHAHNGHIVAQGQAQLVQPQHLQRRPRSPERGPQPKVERPQRYRNSGAKSLPAKLVFLREHVST